MNQKHKRYKTYYKRNFWLLYVGYINMKSTMINLSVNIFDDSG